MMSSVFFGVVGHVVVELQGSPVVAPVVVACLATVVVVLLSLVSLSTVVSQPVSNSRSWKLPVVAEQQMAM